MQVHGVHIRLSVQCTTKIKLQSYAALATQLGFSQFCLVIVLESQQNKSSTKCEPQATYLAQILFEINVEL